MDCESLHRADGVILPGGDDRRKQNFKKGMTIFGVRDLWFSVLWYCNQLPNSHNYDT